LRTAISKHPTPPDSLQNSTEESAVAPMQGVRVVRLGNSPAAQRLERLLSDQGAHPLMASAATHGNLAVLLEAISSADVLITGSDIHMADHAGLNLLTLRERYPKLVHCHLPAFPAERPGPVAEFADALVSAEVGLLSIDGDQPRHEALPIPSAMAAMLGATHVAAALYARCESGRGERIEVPLSAAAMLLMGQVLTKPLDSEVVDAYAAPRLPLVGSYRCSDGRWILVHLPAANFLDILLTAADKLEWREEAMKALVELPDAAAVEVWRQRLSDWFSKRPAREWEQALTSAGGGCTICMTAEEWAREPQALEAGLVPAPERGNSRVAAVKVERGTTNGSPRPVIGSRKSREPKVTGVQSSSGPLRDLRVVDLGLVIAGPTCGRTLGELGAEVVKVDSPNRPPRDVKTWIDVARGKRSLLVDLKLAGGREVLWRLLAEADVVIENFREGKLDALGFSHAAIAARNPRIVYVSVRAFGTVGPWGGRPGWEHSGQAATGMMLRRSVDGTPRSLPLPLLDYGTGLLAAFGATAALFARERTGIGSRVSATLVQTSSFVLGTDVPEAPRMASQPALVRRADGWWAVDPRASEGPSETTPAVSERADIAAAPVRGTDQLPAVEWITRSGALVTVQHPRLGRIQQVIGRVCAEGYAQRIGPVPDLGGDTRELLAELGYERSEIDHLLASRAVAERV